MSAARADILVELTEMINAVLGDFATDQVITMDTTFQDDLNMESIDVVSLAGRLQARYGDTVNFALFVAKLDLKAVSELRVGQLVEHIATSLDAADREPAGAGADEVGAGRR